MGKLVAIMLMAATVSCTATKPATNNNKSAPATVIDGKIWGSLFQQKAAEYAALCYQAYNAARFSLNKSLEASHSKPLAIITDIDETVLDNSPYAVQSALQGKDYESATWYNWTNKGIAKPMPGSLDFFNYAASKNVTIFYITNRDEKERAGTLTNLKKFNYPFSDNEHLILKKEMSSKGNRRKAVAEHYAIVMLLGDNLSDFSTLWDKKTTAERMQNVNSNAAEFGTRFIVLPNITYGGWEDAIYGNNYNLTPVQKDSAIKANIKGY